MLGMDTMEKISQLKVLIIGLRGLGAEIAKDIIVSGPKKVSVFDPNLIDINDLGSNFYLTKESIGKRRDKSCYPKLKEINKFIDINVFLEETTIQEIYPKIRVPGNYNVLVISEIIPTEIAKELNRICRSNKIRFIYAAVCGLTSFIFSDFGPEYTILDEYGLKKRKFYIKNIEKSEEGLVEIQWEKNEDPFIEENIIFKEVEGMEEINFDEKNNKIWKINSRKSPTQFYVGNTLNFSDYQKGGFIEEVFLPKKMIYKSFEEKIGNEPFETEEEYEINRKKKFLFIGFKALFNFFDKNGRLPFLQNINDFEEVNQMCKDNYNNYKGINNSEIFEDVKYEEKMIKDLSFTSRAEITCLTSMIGGIVCQEIIKATGKFKPINQWEFFNFLQYSKNIPINIDENNFKSNSRYKELISVYGEEIVNKIQNLNILLAGAGALGCEDLKILALLGLSSKANGDKNFGNGSVLVIDDDNVEISNLNRQFFYHEKHKGKSKSEIACHSAKEINPDFNCNYLKMRISPENKFIFNKNYFDKVDIVLGAIDTKEGNYYLTKQCELNEKIFMKGGTNGPSGLVESFIPKKTISYNDKQYVDFKEEKIPSCTRREFPTKIEDCIDNGRDLFDEYFVTRIEELLDIIKNKGKGFYKLEVEAELNKFNIIFDYIYFLIEENKNEIFYENYFYFGLQEYEKLFVYMIKHIYECHPLNDSNESKTFWNNRRQPKEDKFNIDNKLSVEFLFNFLKILANLLKIKFDFDENSFKEKIKEVYIKFNNLNLDKKINDLYVKTIDNAELLYEKLLSKINVILADENLKEKILKIEKLDFEKDIPELGHVKFVHSFSNLKAKSYKIPSCDKFYTLEYVGKIGPTSITSTSVVAGLMTLQMIGLIINQTYNKNNINEDNNEYIEEDEDDEELIENGLHNFSFNLKSNIFDFLPLDPISYNGKWIGNNLIPEKYSRWKKIIIKGKEGMTIKEFNEYIKNKYGVNVTLIISAEDERDIFRKKLSKGKFRSKKEKEMEKLLERNLDEVYFNTAQNICKKYERNNDIFLKVKGLLDNGQFVEFPVIKYET